MLSSMKLKVPSLTKATLALPCSTSSQTMAGQTRNGGSATSWYKGNRSMLPCNKRASSSTTSNKHALSHRTAPMQQVSAMEMREMKEAFNFFDENHDGKITAAELGMALRRLGDNPTDKVVRDMLKEVDIDGDGVISFEEFMALQPFIKGISGQVGDDEKSYHDDMRDAFLRFDANKDGLISPQELHGVMARLGRSCSFEECCLMIKHIDHDGDGHVNFEEFQLMMA